MKEKIKEVVSDPHKDMQTRSGGEPIVREYTFGKTIVIVTANHIGVYKRP